MAVHYIISAPPPLPLLLPSPLSSPSPSPSPFPPPRPPLLSHLLTCPSRLLLYPPAVPPSQLHQIQEIRAPFEVNSTPSYQSGLVFHNNAWKTPNQIVAETNAQSDSRPVVDTFPVSTGVEHQKQEDEQDAQRASEAINIYSKFQVCVNTCTYM